MNAPCERFEQEGLLLLEEGRELPPHFASCPDCQKARGDYERLTKAMSAPPERRADEFEQKVWARIDSGEQLARLPPELAMVSGGAPQKARVFGARRAWAIPAVAAAAVAIGLATLLVPRQTAHPPRDMLALRLDVARRPGSDRRGTPPANASGGALYLQPGDALVLDASTGGAANAEVRIYREDRQLVFRCPPGCAREGDRITGRVPLPSVGKYQAYVVSSNKPLPQPAATLPEDTERLLAAGAHVSLGPSVQVY